VKVVQGWTLRGRGSAAAVELKKNGVLLLKVEAMDWLEVGVEYSG
jgi:hypothetical protein